MARRTRARVARRPAFNAGLFLDSAAGAQTIVHYGRGDTIFTQGDACAHLLYVRSGGVKVSVQSTAGHEAVVAMLGPGDFLGEGCLAGQPLRVGSAMAIRPTVVLFVESVMMKRLLREQRAMADRFISHILTRHIRMEEDLIDQLFDASEKRLARTLLLLARYGRVEDPARTVPYARQRLADAVGITGGRVKAFLDKFRTLGFIEYQGDMRLKINPSLLNVVLNN
jgi:CRP-like cAMP-binding protein